MIASTTHFLMFCNSRHIIKSPRVVLRAVINVALLLGAGNAACAAVLFTDHFGGPTLDQSWQAVFPNGAPLGPNSTTYIGAAGYAFQTQGGASVLQLSNTLSTLQRIGWTTSQHFDPSDFTYEARINTENQSPTTGIDGMIELSLVDVSNPTRIDTAALFGSFGSAARLLQAESTIDGNYHESNFDYQNDTWYRLQISGSLTSPITFTVRSDDGTPLASYAFGHTMAAFPSGFKLGLSQSMGFPNSPAPVLVGVDYVQLTAMPEPSALLMAAVGVGVFLLSSPRIQAGINVRKLGSA